MDVLAHLHARGDAPIIASPGMEPYTTPALTANLVFRVILALVANLVCLVPLRLLHRNGELAAVVFIVNIELKNIQTIVYALIWRDDNTDSWWTGQGLCDFHPYFHNFTISVYSTCMLAIMRNISHQVGLMTAHPLTVTEKRRRNLIQALFIFPLPIIQLALTWPLTAGRYAIGTLVGCGWINSTSWPYLVFFVLAPVIVSLGTVWYSALAYIRFRQVAKGNDLALSRNRLVNHRAQRARRRLYLMVVSVLVPYFPIIVALAVFNIFDMGTVTPYSYDDIHNHETPVPWAAILLLPSSQISFVFMNDDYIPILTAIPVFLFFGTTKEAINNYRTALVCCGLGPCFPSLHREYDPDRTQYTDRSNNSSQITTSTPTESSIRKFRTIVMPRSLSTLSTLSSLTSGDTSYRHTSTLSSRDVEAGQVTNIQPARDAGRDATVRRNPFLMRTSLDIHPVPFRLPSILRAFTNRRPAAEDETIELPLRDVPATPDSAMNPGVHTRVWSEDEMRRSHSTPDPACSEMHGHGVRVDTTLTHETQDALIEDQRRCPGCGRWCHVPPISEE